ncbi:unnamed protein product, partial [marine sediment metagenome]
IDISLSGWERFCKENSWKLPVIMEKLGINQRGGLSAIYVFTKLGIINIFKEELERVCLANGGNFTKTAEYFGVLKATIDNWIVALRLKGRIEQKLRVKQSKLTEKELQRIFESCNYKIWEMAEKLKSFGCGKPRDFIKFLESINKENFIKQKLQRLIVKEGMALKEIGDIFGINTTTIREWLIRLKLDKDTLKRRRRMFQILTKSKKPLTIPELIDETKRRYPEYKGVSDGSFKDDCSIECPPIHNHPNRIRLDE